MGGSVSASSKLATTYSESWLRLQRANQTADQLQSYWIGLLSICAFIFATAMSVSHHDIFLEKPLTLPFVLVEMPLLWFFAVSPLTLLLLHVFILVKYRLLLISLVQLRQVEKSGSERKGHPPDLENHFNASILMQSLVSRNANHPGMQLDGNRFASFFGPILSASLVVVPIIVLLILQAKILPYQKNILEWEYRILILSELIIIYWAFSEYWKAFGGRLWMFAVSAIIVLWVSCISMSSHPDAIKNGYWDAPNWRPWSPILSPTNRDFVDDAKLKSADSRIEIILRHRSFVGADLQYADLRGMDLQDSNFTHANLFRARIDNSVLKNATFDFANLDRASLVSAQMDRASFIGASLRETVVSGADVRGSDFHGANLEGAFFDGSLLKDAKLVGANLRNANFVGASLKRTELIASYLGNANFRGSDLKKADFTGAVFNGEEMISKSLRPNFFNPTTDNFGQLVRVFHLRKREDIKLMFEKSFWKSRKFQKSKFSGHLCLRTLHDLADKTRNDKFREHEGSVEVEALVKDQLPIFDSAYLKDTRVDLAKRRYFRKTITISACPDSRCERSMLAIPTGHWEMEKYYRSNAYKLELAGCGRQIASRIFNDDVIELNLESLDKQSNSTGEPRRWSRQQRMRSREQITLLENIVCRSGSYPHVANAIISSGTLNSNRFHNDDLVHHARNIIQNRCYKGCPGARALSRQSVARVWQLANGGETEWNKSIPRSSNGVPDMVYDCVLWKSFNLQVEVN